MFNKRCLKGRKHTHSKSTYRLIKKYHLSNNTITVLTAFAKQEKTSKQVEEFV